MQHKTTILILIYFFTALIVRAQSDSHVLNFRGGDVAAELRVQWPKGDWIAVPADSGRPGFMVQMNGNPAFQIMARGSAFTISGGLPVAINVAPVLNLNASARNTVNNTLAAYRLPETKLAYPDLETRFQSVFPVDRFSFSGEWKDIRFELGWNRELTLLSDLRASGLEAQIVTPISSGDGVSDVLMNSRVQGINGFDLQTAAWRIAAARRIDQHVTLGLSLVRRTLVFETHGRADIGASMLYRGQEYLFNDPAALWPTDLNQSVDGRYQGDGVALHLGLLFEQNSRWIWDVQWVFHMPWRLTGDLDIVQNRIPALNESVLFEDSDGEILDAEKLKLSQLTLTRPVINPDYHVMRIQSPVEFRVGGTHIRTNTVYRLILNLHLGDTRITTGPSSLDLGSWFGFHFQFGYKRFFAQLGGRQWRANLNNGAGVIKINESLVLPEIEAGLSCGSGQWRFVPHLMLLPVPALSVRVHVRF